MRKQTKLVAVLSASALLAIGASMTSFAATGWVNENGTFYYYDNDGDAVTNEWKKDGNAHFYLGDDGAMLTNEWVEDEYYVGPNGAMVKNAWVKTLGSDYDEEDVEADGEAWYYFNSKGQKVANKEMKINNKFYRFDENGKMLTGWQEVDGNVYYYGGEDDGARKSGWFWLETPSEEGEVDADLYDQYDYDTEAWYYFGSNGARYESMEKKINGKYYSFNAYGQMNYGWVRTTDWTADGIEEASGSNAGIADLKYYFNQDNGSRVTGFIKIEGPNATGKQDDTNWYYFKDGKAKVASTADAVTIGEDTYTFKREKLEGKYFAFDTKGIMQTGKKAIKDGEDYAVYYFDGDGYMKTGKVDGIDDTTYYFETKNINNGKGITAEKDGYVYYKGRRQVAEDDYKFVTLPNGKTYLVNAKGKVQKSTSKEYDVELIENLDGTGFVKIDKNGNFTQYADKDAEGVAVTGDFGVKAPF